MSLQQTICLILIDVSVVFDTIDSIILNVCLLDLVSLLYCSILDKISFAESFLLRQR
jgi:hypothetical protein